MRSSFYLLRIPPSVPGRHGPSTHKAAKPGGVGTWCTGFELVFEQQRCQRKMLLWLRAAVCGGSRPNHGVGGVSACVEGGLIAVLATGALLVTKRVDRVPSSRLYRRSIRRPVLLGVCRSLVGSGHLAVATCARQRELFSEWFLPKSRVENAHGRGMLLSTCSLGP